MASRLLGLLLVPWTARLAGGQSVTHTGLPIMASLANKAVSFGCSITYQYTPKFKNFTVSYFYVDLQGRTSAEKETDCRPGPGVANQTYVLDCRVTPRLPSASATGTYYCHAHWPSVRRRGNGTFILVRDTGYLAPPQSSQKALLLSFTGLLGSLSALATAALLWKKKQMPVTRKRPDKKHPEARSAGRAAPAPADSVYTALQRRETEVYACIESEPCSPPVAPSPPSQENWPKFEEGGEFNLVYENL